MIILEIRRQNSQEMSLAQHNHMIQALAADTADHAFDERILPSGFCSRDDFFDAHVCDARLKIQTVDAITIANEEPWSELFGERFNDLLRSPHRRRMGGHVEMNDAPTIVAEDYESVQNTERRCRDNEKVDSHKVSQMIVKECPPRLRGWLALSDPILAYGRFGHGVTQQCEFGLDARHTPTGILTGHPSNQFADFNVNAWSSWLPSTGLPSPEQLEAAAVPTDDGVRLHDEKGGTPIRPDLGQDRPEYPVTLSQSRALGSVLQSGQLLAEREVFSREVSSVAKNPTDEQPQHTDQAHFIVSRNSIIA